MATVNVSSLTARPHVCLVCLQGPDHEAGGRILGYQVRQCLQEALVLNATECTAPLVMEEGNCSVTVTAFNAAGVGPAAQLSIDTHTHNSE